MIVIDEIGANWSPGCPHHRRACEFSCSPPAHGVRLKSSTQSNLSDWSAAWSVTLSDVEARRRAPADGARTSRPTTFDVQIEIQDRNLLPIMRPSPASVDCTVRAIAGTADTQPWWKRQIQIQEPHQRVETATVQAHDCAGRTALGCITRW